jgi:hypothetical protein
LCRYISDAIVRDHIATDTTAIIIDLDSALHDMGFEHDVAPYLVLRWDEGLISLLYGFDLIESPKLGHLGTLRVFTDAGGFMSFIHHVHFAMFTVFSHSFMSLTS